MHCGPVNGRDSDRKDPSDGVLLDRTCVNINVKSGVNSTNCWFVGPGEQRIVPSDSESE